MRGHAGLNNVAVFHGVGVTPFGGLVVVHQRAGVVLLYALAVVKHKAQVGQRGGVALLGGQFVPAHGLRVIARHALGVAVHKPDLGLGAGVAEKVERVELANDGRVVGGGRRGQVLGSTVVALDRDAGGVEGLDDVAFLVTARNWTVDGLVAEVGDKTGAVLAGKAKNDPVSFKCGIVAGGMCKLTRTTARRP